MTTVIRKVHVRQMGLLMGVIYAFLGVVLVPILLLTSGKAAEGGVAAALLMMLLYPVLGFLGGMLTAWIFNLSANLVGGLRVDLEDAPQSPEDGQAL